MTEDHLNRPYIDGASRSDLAAANPSVGAVAAQKNFEGGTAEEFTGSTTWMFTMAILAGLLLIGFFTGFVTRGAATAAVPIAPIQDYVITGSTIDATSVTIGASSHLKIASNASDQFLSMRHGANDEWHAVIKLHASSPDQPDELSIVRILPDGQIQETLRRPGTGQSDITALAAMAGGAYFAYSTTNEVAIQKVNSSGNDVWSKSFPSLLNETSVPQIYEVNGDLVLFASAENVNQRRLAVIDEGGNLSWERTFDAYSGSQLSIGSSGEMFLLTPTESGTEIQLSALTPTGATAWETSISVSEGEHVMGMAVTDIGGIVVATQQQGSLTLAEFDVTGLRSNFVQLEDVLGGAEPVNLSATESGNFIVYGFSENDAVSRKIHLKQLGTDGSIIGNAETVLSNSATLEFVQTPSVDKIVLAGSDRPDRYAATDVFVTTLSLDLTPDLVRPSDSRQDMMAELRQEQSIAPEVKQVAFRQPDETLTASTPVVAEQAPQVSAANLESSALSTSQQTALPRAALTRFMPSTLQSQSASREPQATQCRFTCTEYENETAAFPIWRPIGIGAETSIRAVEELHSAVCEAAGGLALQGIKPDCTG